MNDRICNLIIYVHTYLVEKNVTFTTMMSKAYDYEYNNLLDYRGNDANMIHLIYVLTIIKKSILWPHLYYLNLQIELFTDLKTMYYGFLYVSHSVIKYSFFFIAMKSYECNITRRNYTIITKVRTVWNNYAVMT